MRGHILGAEGHDGGRSSDPRNPTSRNQWFGEHRSCPCRRALVDSRRRLNQGCWLYYLGRFRESVSVNEAALKYLPVDEASNRFAAQQTLGLSFWALGELDDAQRYADLAAEIAPAVGPWQRAQLAWLEARIATSREDYEPAERLFRETADFFTPRSAADTAVVSTELVRVLLLQGRAAEAQDLAVTMLQFIEPLRHNRLASAAMADLWRSAATGRGLSVELVDRTIRRLEQGRAQGCARPPEQR